LGIPAAFPVYESDSGRFCRTLSDSAKHLTESSASAEDMSGFVRSPVSPKVSSWACIISRKSKLLFYLDFKKLALGLPSLHPSPVEKSTDTGDGIEPQTHS
jgi:hypothetical protein